MKAPKAIGQEASLCFGNTQDLPVCAVFLFVFVFVSTLKICQIVKQYLQNCSIKGGKFLWEVGGENTICLTY